MMNHLKATDSEVKLKSGESTNSNNLIYNRSNSKPQNPKTPGGVTEEICRFYKMGKM